MAGKLLGGPCMGLRTEEKPCKFITTCLQQKRTFKTALPGLRKGSCTLVMVYTGTTLKWGGCRDLKRCIFLPKIPRPTVLTKT